jgi:cation:H+ antiporter
VYLVWIEFLLGLAIIFFAGIKLARYGDAIAEKSGLGRVWIGLLLLAAITSVPEMVTGVSAAALVGEPDLALGTLFGSNLFNLAILAILDIFYPYTPILSIVSQRQMLLAIGGSALIAVAGLSVLIGEGLSVVNLGWISIPSIIMVLLYLFILRRAFRHEQAEPETETKVSLYNDIPLKTVWFKFILAAAAVIASGIWLSFIGEEIAQVTGWGTSFVGSLFLAISTSMPELVVTFAAVRLGAVDMAVADILGSNMFNMAIILPVDLAYIRDSIFTVVTDIHVITAVAGLLMSLLVLLGIRFHRKRKTLGIFGWYTPLLVIIYLIGFYTLFRAGIN